MRAHPRRSFSRFVLALVLALGITGASACATTTAGISPDRQQRISECLKQCPATHAESGPANVGDRTMDQRNDCERRCHQLR